MHGGKGNTIDNFVSLMGTHRGFARPSRYEIILTAPQDLNPLFAPEASREISLLCDTISMPGHDLQTHSAKYGTGIETMMVNGHGYEGTIAATFYLDVPLHIKRYFDTWQELAISTTRNTAAYYKNDNPLPGESTFNYVGTMEIYQLSSRLETQTTLEMADAPEGYHKEAYGVNDYVKKKTSYDTHKTIRTHGMKVEEVYPATIGAIEYAYETTDTIAKLAVEFQYRKWETIRNWVK